MSKKRRSSTFLYARLGQRKWCQSLCLHCEWACLTSCDISCKSLGCECVVWAHASACACVHAMRSTSLTCCKLLDHVEVGSILVGSPKIIWRLATCWCYELLDHNVVGSKLRASELFWDCQPDCLAVEWLLHPTWASLAAQAVSQAWCKPNNCLLCTRIADPMLMTQTTIPYPYKSSRQGT